MDLQDAHLGIQVQDLADACDLLTELFGLTFAEPISGWPIRVRVGDDIEHSEGNFTVSRQGPPFVEVTENVAGSQVWQSDGRPLAFHHLGFWVDDVHAASEQLAAAGYPVQAGGLDEAGRYRYTYHDVNGLRVEMADARARAAFERQLSRRPRALLARADELDLVVISSPPDTHYATARAALEAGLDVVIDKPFVVTAEDGRRLMAYAAERGRQLTVFQNRRFNGDFLTVRRLVREGRLGQIHRFDSRFEWYKPDEPKLWKAHTGAEQGGGILYDLGPHLIGQALRIFGPAVHSYAELARYRQGEGADDEAFLALQLASSILDGAPLPVDPAESLAGIELIETVYAETATVRR